MKFEIEFKIYGSLKIPNNIMEIKSFPYIIKIFKSFESYFISVSKPIDINSTCLPIMNLTDDKNQVVLPEESSYFDMIEIVNHIESFGSIDNKFEYIDKTNIILRWIAENENDHFSPLKEIKREKIENQELDIISEDWLRSTIIHKNQLGELFIPFSFYRDGKNLFHSFRYQSSFCTFYMMLEYFFHEKSWGIQNDAFKRKNV